MKSWKDDNPWPMVIGIIMLSFIIVLGIVAAFSIVTKSDTICEVTGCNCAQTGEECE